MTIQPSDITTAAYEFRTVFDYQIIQGSLNTGSYEWYYDVSKAYECYEFDNDLMKAGEFTHSASGYYRCGLHFFGTTHQRKVTYARFPRIQINPGATIVSAYLELYNTGSYGSSYDLDIYCEDVDNGTNPQTAIGIEDFDLTSTKVNTTLPALGSAAWMTTASVVPLVQHIVDRDGWQEFNNITFVFKNGTYGFWRYWAGQNGAYAPKLHIVVRD